MARSFWISLCFFRSGRYFYWCFVVADGFSFYEADSSEGEGADNPFGVDDVGEDADGGDEHPEDEDGDGGKEGVEGGASGAEPRGVHGHEDDDGEGGHEGEAGHEGGDDAADGEGEAEGQKTQGKDGEAGDFHVFPFRHGWIDEAFMDVVGVEGGGGEEQVACGADVGGPEGGEGDACDPWIERHDEARKGGGCVDIRVHFSGDDAQERGEEADGEHNEAADDEAFLCGADVFGTEGNLDDGLEGEVHGNEDNDPGGDGHSAHAADEVEGVDGGHVKGDVRHAAGQLDDDPGSDGDADVLEGDVQEVRLAGGPHAADQGDADEDDGAYQHAGKRREEIRKESREDGAASDELEAHDDELDEDLAGNPCDHAVSSIVSFQEFRHGRDVHTAVSFSDREAHDNGADAPGSGVPAGREALRVRLLSHADCRRAADSQADHGNHDERSRQLSSREHVVFDRTGRTVLHVRTDQEEHANVGADDEDLNE